MNLSDPVGLTAELIKCASVTPEDAGARDLLAGWLRELGFDCHAVDSATGGPLIRNLYARRGSDGINFCFAGHTDVVPVGASGWSVEPFAGTILNNRLYGRGATDMKGAIACFVAAVSRFVAKGQPAGSISLLITGDEEGPAVDGTVKVLDWLKVRGERLDMCLVGEPTNPGRLGEMMKIGRRGSLNCRITVFGTQGHSAYPHLADNPIPRLLAMLNALTAEPLDHGSPHFQASTLALTTVDVGNAATNVIPAQARAGFNIRFNDLHSGKSLEQWIRHTLDSVGGDYECKIEVSGESFLTEPGVLSEAVAECARAVTGLTPELSTTGGTSDARFIKNHCPVLEFGLVSQTMHKVDEYVAVDDLEALTQIYLGVLERLVGSQ
ncbi:N-succinyl-diaminopimelate deacylase [Magnetospirillum gryphiswaldense MSR-1 v2]|uniref:Succinyl-diaminopimelate desuccinylase n=1 Tax=Magnetospirillum gryphiswaldense (strain DSM 6361 / JCM 21280 / NBRC 15271 / MSR-1) TaxID=431944 RepID=V6F602_MAGGM|nr:succinyl-diaminopimelate desuccinylase [Magnetospirillum gryphiswaldense]CDL00782.1 N-succinyl-diaminopimelate deacylase [Magnetospirillum gryphiswaldense MSR-1 v2]